MAKEKAKKFKRKGKKFGQPNAKIKKVKISKVGPTKTIVPASPAPLVHPAEATASDPPSNYNGGASRSKEKEKEKGKRLAGFIFMCNPSTKLECYQYRVFGLPSGKKEVVEEIKPGAKLFLFDFESKLLYGIYEATSAGKLNLEPAAFKGKFPAQVKFKIFKECLPLPESSLRHVIKENYTGSKFQQELSGKQVRKLLSSFRPLNASSTSQLATQALPNVSLSLVTPPSAMENRFRHTGRFPTMEVPYLAELQYGRIPPLDQQHGYHISAYVERAHPTLDHRRIPTINYFVPNSRQPSFTEGAPHGVQEPFYSRTIEEKAPHDQGTGLGRRYKTVPHDPATSLQRQYRHQLPLHREAVYQDNNAAAYNSNLAAPAQYTSSVTQLQPQVPVPFHHQQPLQGGAQYEDSLVAHNSNPAAPAQYTNAPVTQPQVLATYQQQILQREAVHRDNMFPYNSSYSTASARYASSVTQPREVAAGVSQRTAPITSYYSYIAANPLIR